MINWPLISKQEFKDHDSLEWMLTSGKKQRNKIKYRLYWSSRDGGLWVSDN